MKLIIIGSEGPMGKSLACALLEKLRFINLPVRKRGINDYVTNKREISDLYFKKRTLVTAKELSNLDVGGGISVLERNKNARIKKIELKIIKSDLKIFYKKKFKNFSEMFFDSMSILNKGTIYKKKIYKPKGAIENSKDISSFDYHRLVTGYKKNFSKPYFIFLNRDFSSWLNSLTSQIMIKNYKNPLKYRIRLSSQVSRYKKWQQYLNQNKNTGINLEFEQFFKEKKLIKMIRKISKYINESVPNIKWKKADYDCFGYIYKYERAFSKVDDANLYLSNLTTKIAKLSYSNNCMVINLIFDFAFQIFFFLDLINFKLNKKYL